jgi:nucleoside-diphosphate-sugar epimerase
MTAQRVLMTGATGSFGRYVAAELVERGCELIVLARGHDDMDARRRAHRTIRFPLPGIRVVRGDVAAEGLGLSHAGRALARSAEIVLHAAATTDCGVDLDAARRVNFDGTRNLLALAHRVPGLQKLIYVSATCVAGKRCGHVLEPQLHDAGFLSPYERTKYEAERLVRAHSQVLPVAVVRPSLVVDVAPALRLALDVVARGLLPVLPGAATNALDVIPANDAAAAIARIVLARGALGTFHVAAGDRAPRVTEVIRVATRRRLRFVEHTDFRREVERREFPEAIAPFIGALAYPKTFDTARIEAVLGAHPCASDPLQALAASFPRATSVIGA